MKHQEIYKNLCTYDKRNPYFCEEFSPSPNKQCFCDNCFYGRTELALYILELQEKLNTEESGQ